jgi:hypothetical protein
MKGAPSTTPSLSAGFLASIPLFAAYEVGELAQGPSVGRSSAEAVLTLLFEPLGARAQFLRWGLLAGFLVLALWRQRARGEWAPRALGALALLGILSGLLLGPILVALQSWLDAVPLGATPEPARSLSSVLRLVGAAPWEEVLFRVSVYGALFLAVRRTSLFLGLAPGAARGAAELVGLLGSACLFALFHLGAVQRLLELPGEPFHRGLFLWRVSAGVLLGALFRWRGLGVAAWAHAVFNLGIALGIRA